MQGSEMSFARFFVSHCKRVEVFWRLYDFDRTLSPGNMQEFGLIQATGKTKEEFWDRILKSAIKPFSVLPSVYTSSHLCDALGYKRAYLAVKQHIRSSDAAKRCVARIAKNRYGECKGKMRRLEAIRSIIPIMS